MTQISFKGTLITNMNVRKAGYTLPTHKVSIVRVNPNNEADLRALREVEDSWQGNFTKQIYKDAERINSGIIPEFPETFFIMTEQKDKFSKLNPDDILAEAKIIRDFPAKNKIYIDYLQVQPDNSFDSPIRTLEGLGTSFLKFIKNHYKGKELSLRSLFSTIDFYKKNGFKLVRKDSNLMKYIAK